MKKNLRKKVEKIFEKKIKKIDYRKILNEKNLKTYDDFFSNFFWEDFFLPRKKFLFRS